MAGTNDSNGKDGKGANLEFKQILWVTDGKMRGHMNAAENKHVALVPISFKYILDAFQKLYDDLAARQERDYTYSKDRDEYIGMNVFWVPKEARWSHIRATTKQTSISKLIDDAMLASD